MTSNRRKIILGITVACGLLLTGLVILSEPPEEPEQTTDQISEQISKSAKLIEA